MEWTKGLLIACIEYKGYMGFIQRTEGRSGLYVFVDLPDGNRIIKNENEIVGWNEARQWVESEINNRISGV